MAAPLVLPLTPSPSTDREETIGQEPNDDGPVPLSFPAILINRRQKPVNPPTRKPAPASRPRDPLDPEGRGGKRRRRRAENDILAGNPHVVRPSDSDLFPRPRPAATTFPAPLPSAFGRSVALPPAEVPGHDPTSAELGKFHRSLKGVRRSIRRIAGNGEACRGVEIVELVDSELRRWLSEMVWRPDELVQGRARSRVVDATPFGDDEDEVTIRELTRAPHALTWAVSDPFARFIVHCTARYYGVVSFGKTDLEGKKVIFLMRAHSVGVIPPRTAEASPAGAGSLITPPASGTDIGSGTEDDDLVSLQSSVAELDLSSTDEDFVHVNRGGASRPMSSALSTISDVSGAESDGDIVHSPKRPDAADERTPRPIRRSPFARSRLRSTSSSPSRSLSPQRWTTGRARRAGRRIQAQPTASRGARDLPEKTMLEWASSQ